MFKKDYNIRLELNGRLIHEISSAKISNDIVIGRSSECTWTVPAEDRSVSGQHARLFLKGKSIFIQDLKSRNGIYFMGEKIQERKIAKGDTYSIGDSKLVIDELAAEAVLTKNSLPHHRLEQLTGKNRGKIYQLIGLKALYRTNRCGGMKILMRQETLPGKTREIPVRNGRIGFLDSRTRTAV